MGRVRRLEVFIQLLIRKPRMHSFNVPTQSRPTEDTEDVFHCYSSLIYSSNSFSIPQFIEIKKENRELTFRKRVERKMCKSKVFAKEIVFSSPIYKYDFFKKHFVTEPKTLRWLGLHSVSILVQISPSLLHAGKQYCFHFTEMCNQIFIYAPVIKV